MIEVIDVFLLCRVSAAMSEKPPAGSEGVKEKERQPSGTSIMEGGKRGVEGEGSAADRETRKKVKVRRES